MRIREIHFDNIDLPTAAVVEIESVDSLFVDGLITLSTPIVKIGEAENEHGGSEYTLGSVTFSSPTSDFSDLSSLYTILWDTGTPEYVSDQEILDRLIARYPNGTVVMRGPERPGVLGNPDSGPWFVTYTIVGRTGATKVDVNRQSSVVNVEDNNTGQVTFYIGQRSSDEQVAINQTATVTGYQQKKPEPGQDPVEMTFEVQSDGTIKVDNGDEKWSFTVSHPTIAAQSSTEIHKFDKKGQVV